MMDEDSDSDKDSDNTSEEKLASLTSFKKKKARQIISDDDASKGKERSKSIIELDEEETALNSLLGNDDDDNNIPSQENTNVSANEEEEKEEDKEDDDIQKKQMSFEDNGVRFSFFLLDLYLIFLKLIIKRADVKPKSRSRQTKSGSGSRGNKVTENDFSPNSKRLAIVAKNHLRYRAATGEAFPAANAAMREEFIMNIIQEAAKLYGGAIEPKLTSVLSRVVREEDTLEKLTTFVCIPSFLKHMLNFILGLVWKDRPSQHHCNKSTSHCWWPLSDSWKIFR